MSDYQGWTNKDTWHINTILTNDEPTLTATQRVFDKGYYESRFRHFLDHRVEGQVYEDWAESDRQGVFGGADALKDWVERCMEEMVDLNTTARPAPIKPARMQTDKKRKDQLCIQQSMRFIAGQAIQDALDRCDWVDIAESFDERRKEILSFQMDCGPREENASAV